MRGSIHRTHFNLLYHFTAVLYFQYLEVMVELHFCVVRLKPLNFPLFFLRMQLLREKLKRRESDASFYPDEEEEDEKDEGEEELEEYEKDAPFPMVRF